MLTLGGDHESGHVLLYYSGDLDYSLYHSRVVNKKTADWITNGGGLPRNDSRVVVKKKNADTRLGSPYRVS